MDMERIIALYMDDCHSRQLRPKTMQNYEQALKLFATWLEERHEITQVEAVKDIHIRSYINDLQARGKYTFCVDRHAERFNHPQNRRDYQAKISNTTINNYLRNMRAFFRWLVEVEYRVAMKGAKYDRGAAIGLFQSVIGFVMIMTANWTTRKIGEESIWYDTASNQLSDNVQSKRQPVHIDKQLAF